jgi:hypothetical protein
VSWRQKDLEYSDPSAARSGCFVTIACWKRALGAKSSTSEAPKTLDDEIGSSSTVTKRFLARLLSVVILVVGVTGVLPAPAIALSPDLPVEIRNIEPPSLGATSYSQSGTIDAGGIYDMIGAAWEVSSPEVPHPELSEPLLEVRSALKEGEWGPWMSSDETDGADAANEAGDRVRVSVGPVYLGPFRYIEIRWRPPEGASGAPEISLIDIRGRNASWPKKAAAYLRAIFKSRPLSASASSPQPAIISRAGWGADESLRREGPSYGSVKLAIVHHTVSTNSYGPGDSAAIIRGIYAFHVLTNGWNDIGYNFLIDRYGQIFEGRYGGIDQPVIGAHSWGSNSQSTGIAIIGDFSSAAIPGAAYSSLVTLLDWKLDVHSVDPTSRVGIVRADGVPLDLRAVSGHRDAFPTSCPGEGVYRTLDTAAQQARDAGGQKIFGARWTPEQAQWNGSSFEPVQFSAYLKYDAPWKVTVVDARGAPIITRSGSGGTIDVSWDSRFPDGRPVLGGTYFAVVETEGSMTKYIPVQMVGGPRFEQWFLTYNPNTSPVDVTFTLSGNDGVLGIRNFKIQPGARHTFFVNEFVVGKEVAATVDSSLPVVVERAMYFNYQGQFDGGDAAFLAPEAATEWYFAEGYTGGSFAEYLTLYNPGGSEATAQIEFLFNPSGSQLLDVILPPRTRKTVLVNAVVGPGKDVAARIHSDLPIVAERPQYFEYSGSRGGDVVLGAKAPSTEWNFAEGYTGRGFHTYLTLANPGSTDAAATVEFFGNEGLIKKLDGVSVKAKGRTTILVNDHVGPGKDVSTRVSSSQPIVAERPVYFGYGPLDGGHVALGAVQSKNGYFFAEGYTAPGFDEYLTILNPNPAPIEVQATYSFPSGSPLVKSYGVGAKSRLTIAVHDEIQRAGEVSVSLSSASGFFAERPMYFYYRGVWKGGSIVQGGAEPATKWYSAEGYTG